MKAARGGSGRGRRVQKEKKRLTYRLPDRGAGEAPEALWPPRSASVGRLACNPLILSPASTASAAFALADFWS